MWLAASIIFLSPLSHNVNGFMGDWHGIATAALQLLYDGFVYGTPQMLATAQSPALGLARRRRGGLGSSSRLPGSSIRFYMIHQTVTVITAYWLLPAVAPVPAPAYLPTILMTFGGTWPICAWVVRP